MAVDTATKRCSALTAWLPWHFGSVPAGTVNRQDALWSYTGITPSAPPTGPFDPADNTSLVQPWKSVNPNRRDPLTLERSIRVLDRQAQKMTDAIMENITNIQNGTTAVPFTWAAYIGP